MWIFRLKNIYANSYQAKNGVPENCEHVKTIDKLDLRSKNYNDSA
jgi:hypothetical protein